MPNCAVKNCKSRQGHLFPKDLHTRRLWIEALGGADADYGSRSFVCSKHFRENDFKGEGRYSGLRKTRKILKNIAIPTEELGGIVRPKKMTDLLKCRRNLVEEFNETCESVPIPLVDNEVIISVGEDDEEDDNNMEEPSEVTGHDIGVQVGCIQILSITNFIKDDEAIHYYTGLENYSKFRFVLQSLGPNRFQLNFKYWQEKTLSVEDQFFMTLIKLRRNTPNFELGRLFGISSASVSNIFITFINFMALQWNELQLWPSRELVDYYMPQAFKASFSKTRIIIDGTEIPIVKPVEPELQQATFSTYKHRNTLKVLVGATPGGFISYTSDAYGGSISDRQIVERSRLRDILEPGDAILADRGFNVQDIFAHKDISVNIPTFLKGKSQLPHVVLTKDRNIANKRIHIERIIGLTKSYKILCQPLNKHFINLGGHIFYVCCMLCNFRSNIVVRD